VPKEKLIEIKSEGGIERSPHRLTASSGVLGLAEVSPGEYSLLGVGGPFMMCLCFSLLYELYLVDGRRGRLLTYFSRTVSLNL
jgi:hypothetical protein